MKHEIITRAPMLGSTGGVAIPAGTDLRTTADRFDRDTDRMAVEFVANVHPSLKRDAERTFRQTRAAFRASFTFDEAHSLAPVTPFRNGYFA